MKNNRLLFRLQRQYVYVASAKLYRFPTDHSNIQESLVSRMSVCFATTIQQKICVIIREGQFEIAESTQVKAEPSERLWELANITKNNPYLDEIEEFEKSFANCRN